MRAISRSKSKASNLSFNQLDTSQLEPEPVRLQREADLFTSKLELERRQKGQLDEQLRQLTEELKIKTLAAKAKIPSSVKLTKLKNKIQRLEHKLELALRQTSKIQAESAELRKVIDSSRLDKYNCKHVINQISHDIYSFSTKAEHLYGSYMEGHRQTDLQQSRIYQLRSKSQHDSLSKNVRIEELNVRLKQSLIKEDRASKGLFIRNIEQSFNAQLKKNSDTADPTPVLKKLQLKWGNAVKEKKRQIDVHSKHIKLLGEAVEEIKEATGVQSIEEITTTFIKSEQQQYSIGTYLNNLHAEAEAMEENLRSLLMAIDSDTQHSYSAEVEVKGLLSQLKARIEKMEDNCEKSKGEEADLRDDLEAAKQPIKVRVTQNLLDIFEKSAFRATISSDDPKEESSIGDEKLLLKLGELEELLNSLQIFLAMKEGQSSPTLKTLDLSSMSEKLKPTKLVANSEIRQLMELLNEAEEDSRIPLRRDDFKERAKSRLSSVQPKSFRSFESRSLTPQPGRLGLPAIH